MNDRIPGYSQTMDEADESNPLVSTESEIKELLCLFDAPAFARRGTDLEYALGRLHARCRRQRGRHDALLRRDHPGKHRFGRGQARAA